jgi:hypothetical protein
VIARPGRPETSLRALHACYFMVTAKHQTLSCASAYIFPLEGCEGQSAARCNKKERKMHKFGTAILKK